VRGVAASPRLGGPIVRGAIGVVVFLGIGELIGRLGLVSREDLPPPSDVLRTLWEMLTVEGFASDVMVTTSNWLIGLAVSIMIGVPAGLLLGSVPMLNAASRLAIDFLRPIPSVALIPLAILVFGTGTDMRVFVMVFASIWPILFNTIYGLKEVDPLAKETARSFGAGRLRVALTVSLPSAAPFVLTGIRLGATIALILEITAELLGGGGAGGIGKVINIATSGFGRMDVVLAATLVAGVIGLVANVVLEFVSRRGFAWAHLGAPS
jgi:NitT/TauT family transport system permease protein